MASPNDIEYIKTVCPTVSGPVLEVGSKVAGGSEFRKYFYSNEFIGTDIESGEGVDVVCDLTLDHPLPKNYFDLVICCSVLEHTPTPWIMAKILSDLVKPGGKLYINCPWVWKYHKYPDDYYRYSFKAIEFLFSEFTWSNHAYSEEMPNSIQFVDRNAMYDKGRAHVELINGVGKKYLPYSMINMLGTKK